MQRHEAKTSSLQQHRDLMNSVKVEVFTSKQVQQAASHSFMKTRHSSSSNWALLGASMRSSFDLEKEEPDESKVPDEKSATSFQHLTDIVQKSTNKSPNPCFDENAYRAAVISREDLIGKGAALASRA